MNTKPTRNYRKVEGKYTEQQLLQWLREGKTNREIAPLLGCSRATVCSLINDLGLREEQKHYKRSKCRIGTIDTPEKAYLIGFILCDGAIQENNQVEISVALRDREIVDWVCSLVDANISIKTKTERKRRTFPKARMSKNIPDIVTFVGGRLKKERHYPIVRESLERYLLLGAFDADGCITWGRRKDKNRIWQKICFNSSLNICLGIQQVLLKRLNIATAVRPKSGEEDCYTLSFSNREHVLRFLDYIYCDDFVVLHRKYSKACALRLELEENGGTAAKPAQYRAEPAEQEGVETSGAVAKQLNDRTSIQGHSDNECLRDSPNGGTHDFYVLQSPRSA